MKTYYVYILTNRHNRVLYTGFTDDLMRRVEEHKTKQADGFTKKYNCNKLVWFARFSTSKEAKAQEGRIKKWLRVWKVELIEADNPEWIDLSADWYS